jgi:hypothetical protein
MAPQSIQIGDPASVTVTSHICFLLFFGDLSASAAEKFPSQGHSPVRWFALTPIKSRAERGVADIRRR